MNEEEFFERLANFKLKFNLNLTGQMRRSVCITRGPLCPLLAIFEEQFPDQRGELIIEEYYIAGAKLGLDEQLVEGIVAASDNNLEEYPHAGKLRERMLEVLGLSE